MKSFEANENPKCLAEVNVFLEGKEFRERVRDEEGEPTDEQVVCE